VCEHVVSVHRHAYRHVHPGICLIHSQTLKLLDGCPLHGAYESGQTPPVAACVHCGCLLDTVLCAHALRATSFILSHVCVWLQASMGENRKCVRILSCKVVATRECAPALHQFIVFFARVTDAHAFLDGYALLTFGRDAMAKSHAADANSYNIPQKPTFAGRQAHTHIRTQEHTHTHAHMYPEEGDHG